MSPLRPLKIIIIKKNALGINLIIYCIINWNGNLEMSVSVKVQLF